MTLPGPVPRVEESKRRGCEVLAFLLALGPSG